MAKKAMGKPPKPYSNFPLFAHARGYWCKKINNRQESFGPWEWPDDKAYKRSWKAALIAFNRFEEDRARGRAIVTLGEQLDLNSLVAAFLTFKHDQVERDKITGRMFGEYKTALFAFRDAIGKNVTIEQLENDPLPLTNYCRDLDGRLGWHFFNKNMTLIRGMFKWAASPPPQGGDLLDRPFRMLGLLQKRSDKLLRRAKRLHAAEHGAAYLSSNELRTMIAAAGPMLRVQILLGYYCAYGNTDCADLPKTAIKTNPDLALPAGWATIHFPRPKTEVDRAAVIPPELVADLTTVSELRERPPLQESWNQLVFLTRYGMPFVRDIDRYDEGGDFDKCTHIDAVGLMFRKLRQRLSACPDRHVVEYDAGPAECLVCKKELGKVRTLGFYALRHTAITDASGVADIDVLSRWQGHILPGMRRFYVEQIEAHKLLAIAKRLREKLGKMVIGSTGVSWEPWSAATDPDVAAVGNASAA